MIPVVCQQLRFIFTHWCSMFSYVLTISADCGGEVKQRLGWWGLRLIGSIVEGVTTPIAA